MTISLLEIGLKINKINAIKTRLFLHYFYFFKKLQYTALEYLSINMANNSIISIKRIGEIANSLVLPQLSVDIGR